PVGPHGSRPSGRVTRPDVTGATAYMDTFPGPAMRRGSRPRESPSRDYRPLEAVEGGRCLFYTEPAKLPTGNGAEQARRRHSLPRPRSGAGGPGGCPSGGGGGRRSSAGSRVIPSRSIAARDRLLAGAVNETISGSASPSKPNRGAARSLGRVASPPMVERQST